MSDEALWFGRADLQGDAHEGAMGLASFSAWRAAFSAAGLAESDAIPFEQHRTYVGDKIRRTMYLNCWHMSAYESAAMWSLYTAQGQGVAIRSTYSRLSESLRGSEVVYIGTVKYIDPQTEVIPAGNVLWPYLHKRRSFAHERELRAIYWNGRGIHDENPPAGLNIAVDVERLIESIFVAPGQPAWFRSVVTTVVRELARQEIDVRQSDLDGDPIF